MLSPLPPPSAPVASTARCCCSAPVLLATPCRARHACGSSRALKASNSSHATTIAFAATSRRSDDKRRMPTARRTRRMAARAASSSDSSSSTAIVPDRARYHVFEMDGVDFLIGTGDDGRLDVRDAFVCDSSSASSSSTFDDEEDVPTPSYSRAEGHDSPDLPQQPLPFIAVPWEVRFDGDTLYKKPAWSKLLKVYLIAATRTEPSLRLDLTQVVSLDAATRSVRREEVINKATNEDPQHTTLRIRSNGIMLVDAEDVPSPDAIIDGLDDSFPRVVKEEKKRRKPFWFEGTYRTDEQGNELERVRDGRWEEDFEERKGDEEEEEEETEKPAWLTEAPEEPSGGGREGWE